MKKRVIKLIVSFILICALMIGFCSAFASAATPVWLLRAKAGIAAAMMAANIIFEPVLAAGGQALADVIDPLNMVQTVQDTSWSDYLDQSVITVRPDVVTIDGVPYSEIWLGPDAANSLRASGFDFVTAYNLSSDVSNVSYATGLGSIGGVPIYDLGEYATPDYRYRYRSPNIQVPAAVGSYEVGDYTFTVTDVDERGYTRYTVSAPGMTSFSRALYPSQTHENIISSNNLSSGNMQFYRDGGYWNAKNCYINVVSQPFEFDYTSGDIDPTPVEDGLMLRVPSSYDDGTQGSPYNYDIHDLVNVYPQVDDTNGHELIFDPNLNPDFDVDLDMGNILGDIISAVILAKLAELLGDDAEVIYAPFPEKEDPAPVDPDLPDPEVPIGEQDPIWMDDLLRWIKNAIDNLGDRIQDAIDAIHEDIQEIISQISELVDKILEDIELGPAKLFDKALDILKTLFLPLLLPIRAMMNLWHYVVEWLQSVSSPFTWIFGIMSSTSYNMVLPVYALLAGGICISIYKALGR